MAEEGKLTLGEAKEKLENMRTRMRGIVQKADGYIEYTMQAGVSAGTAGVIGLIEGYNGEPLKIGGVDGAGLIGVGLHAMALMGDSKHANLIGAAANGATAVWAHQAGQRAGKRMKENKQAGKPLISGGHVAGEIGAGSPVGGYGEQGIVPVRAHAAE